MELMYSAYQAEAAYRMQRIEREIHGRRVMRSFRQRAGEERRFLAPRSLRLRRSHFVKQA